MVFWIFLGVRGAEAREREAVRLDVTEAKDSRCRVLQNVTEAWATGSPGFCGREVNRAGRTPRAEGSRHEHGRAEHDRRLCEAKTCEGN